MSYDSSDDDFYDDDDDDHDHDHDHDDDGEEEDSYVLCIGI